jgi:ABC-2 type transport system permease protein
MNDVFIIVRKELKEFWKARGSLRARLLSFLPMLLVFGIYLPLQQRQAWTEVPAVSGIWFMMLPLVLAGGTAADSFAGERERHTLETLLATRLSDRDILLGKVLATVLYCVGITWSCALLGWIALNVTKGTNPWFMYTAAVLALITAGTVLVSLLMTSVGVLVSLRASSVRAATQVFSVVTLVLFLGLPVLLQALPAPAKEAIGRALLGADWGLVGLLAALVLLAVDVALLALGVARFQRTRLIME